VIVAQVLLEAHSLDLILDEFELTGKHKDRERLLGLGLMLSVRGLDVLIEEPFVRDPQSYVENMEQRLNANGAAVAEELRQDSAVLRAFLGAECRLLKDLGLSRDAVARTRRAIAAVIVDGQMDPEALGERMVSLRDQLMQDLQQLDDDSRHRAIWRRLSGVLEVLCGAIVVAGDAIVGASAAPATAGISAQGAAVSIGAGIEVISRGVDRAKDAQ